MARQSEMPLVVVTTRLVVGNRETLQRFYPSIGYQTAIRHIVNDHCKLLLEAEARTEGPRNVELSLTAEQLAELGIEGRSDDGLDGASGGDD